MQKPPAGDGSGVHDWLSATVVKNAERPASFRGDGQSVRRMWCGPGKRDEVRTASAIIRALNVGQFTRTARRVCSPAQNSADCPRSDRSARISADVTLSGVRPFALYRMIQPPGTHRP